MITVPPHASPSDVAYLLMKQEHKAMNVLDLIDAVISLMNLDGSDANVKARVYTAFNLDPRLTFIGKGIWGIRDWSPGSMDNLASMPDLLPAEGSYQPKAGDYLWDDEEDDEEGEEPRQSTTEDENEEPLEVR
jgi:DNA-directed RNA polymerase subunit delta